MSERPPLSDTRRKRKPIQRQKVKLLRALVESSKSRVAPTKLELEERSGVPYSTVLKIIGELVDRGIVRKEVTESSGGKLRHRCRLTPSGLFRLYREGLATREDAREPLSKVSHLATHPTPEAIADTRLLPIQILGPPKSAYLIWPNLEDIGREAMDELLKNAEFDVTEDGRYGIRMNSDAIRALLYRAWTRFVYETAYVIKGGEKSADAIVPKSTDKAVRQMSYSERRELSNWLGSMIVGLDAWAALASSFKELRSKLK